MAAPKLAHFTSACQNHVALRANPWSFPRDTTAPIQSDPGPIWANQSRVRFPALGHLAETDTPCPPANGSTRRHRPFYCWFAEAGRCPTSHCQPSGCRSVVRGQPIGLNMPITVAENSRLSLHARPPADRLGPSPLESEFCARHLGFAAGSHQGANI